MMRICAPLVMPGQSNLPPLVVTCQTATAIDTSRISRIVALATHACKQTPVMNALQSISKVS